MFIKITVVDLLLTRLLASERVHGRDIVALVHGGLRRLCDRYRFPNCTFEKDDGFAGLSLWARERRKRKLWVHLN